MKHLINHSFKALILLALTVALGCASAMKSQENTLLSAGFKVITPGTPAQAAKLQSMADGKLVMIQNQGKTYYVFPDKKHNQAYIGGPKQFQAFQAISSEQLLAMDDLRAAELNPTTSYGWGEWGGWGSWELPGGVGGAGWY